VNPEERQQCGLEPLPSRHDHKGQGLSGAGTRPSLSSSPLSAGHWGSRGDAQLLDPTKNKLGPPR
jgi:hypothetical protein